MVGPSCVMEMEDVSFGTVLVIDQLIGLQAEPFESQNPEGVGVLHVLADQGHLNAAVDGPEAFVGPILIALDLRIIYLASGKSIEIVDTFPPSIKLVIITMTCVFCSHTMSQKSANVLDNGPCVAI